MFRIKFPIKEVRHITCKFGRWYLFGKHLGLDCRTKCIQYANGIGTPIRAIADGAWKEVGFDKGKGKYVLISHEGGYESGYYHLERSRYQEGFKEVKCGDIIGHSGNTGRWTTAPHLHLELKKDGVLVDPMIYVKKGDDLIKWAEEKTLLRVNNHGTVHTVIDNKIIEVNKENAWEVLTSRSNGITEKDFKDLKNLIN